MTFVSYAQNFEDVMLWRALKNVENGFYVDVGAWSPDLDSVTRLFYERSWRGINIEPNPDFYKQYLTSRKGDVNLNIALSNEEGRTVIYFVDNPGLSSLDKEIAESHKDIGFDSKPSEVIVSTLQATLTEHAKDLDIHFLKVDVEGFEKQVLLGNDWTQFRPWVLLIEATKPMSQDENYEEWESIVIDAGYVFAYADGLNRFYVATEHQELLSAFKYPPNVFDDFVLHNQVMTEVKASEAEAEARKAKAKACEAEASAQQAETKAQQAEVKAQQAEVKAQQAEAKAQQAEAASNQSLMQLHAVYASTSWRITAPLRWIGRLVRMIHPRSLKPKLKLLLQHAALYANRRPWIRRIALSVLARFPGLKARLFQSLASRHNPAPNVPSELAHLSPRARKIYDDMKSALAKRQQGNS